MKRVVFLDRFQELKLFLLLWLTQSFFCIGQRYDQFCINYLVVSDGRFCVNYGAAFGVLVYALCVHEYFCRSAQRPLE